MKINIFDVVELNDKDKNRATILDKQNNGFTVEIVNSEGISLGNQVITYSDINKVIHSKTKEKTR